MTCQIKTRECILTKGIDVTTTQWLRSRNSQIDLLYGRGERPGNYSTVYLHASTLPALAPEVKELVHRARKDRLDILLCCDANI